MRACFCRGPRPGHDLCPCQERARDEAFEAECRRRGMTVRPAPMPRETLAQQRSRELAEAAERSRRITDTGGVDGTARPSGFF